VRRRSDLGRPNESQRLADFRLGQWRQENSEGSGSDHRGTGVRLTNVVADDDSSTGSHASNGSQAFRQWHFQYSGLDEYGHNGAGPPDFCQFRETRGLRHGPSEIMYDGGEVDSLIRKVSEQYDASCVGHR
jgi:hypothetical protein